MVQYEHSFECIDSESGVASYINVYGSRKTSSDARISVSKKIVRCVLKYLCSSHFKSTQEFQL